MKITAVNTSPRPNWNTAILVKEAVKGAESMGAEVQYFDLYKQEKFTGCISCFGCKRAPNEGRCIYKDGIQPILQAIRESDGVILGTPNYLGQPSAGFHALLERLVFQNLTYRAENWSYREPKTPVLFIMTSNMAEEAYSQEPYAQMIRKVEGELGGAIGPVETMICGTTLQVSDYSRYNWTIFDPEERKERREKVFPQEMAKAFDLGRKLAER